ncbi:MAG: aldehyde dehydrogenase family protein [Deltaproteobacteria bacterium]|nr:aldehyde dehydrogenase family protein [Deltaproteobacteria bacterium]
MGLDIKQIDAIVEKIVTRLSQSEPSLSSGIKTGDGIFQNIDEAVRATHHAQRDLVEGTSIEKRKEIIEVIRKVARDNAKEWAQIELMEAEMGRFEDKVKKIIASSMVPGMEDLQTVAYSGDRGMTIIERAPYGVIGSINPITNAIPTILFNNIMMIAGGNAVVHNPHPRAKISSARAIQAFNQAIQSVGGPPNLTTAIVEPTIESAQALMKHPLVKLLVVTGGHGVIHAAQQSGKKVIAGGPGNPPAIVDETADLEKAARFIVEGASFENDTPCASEKEIIAVESVADELKVQLKRNGAYEINAHQLDQLVSKVFREVRGPGKAGLINYDYIGKDAGVLLGLIGVKGAEDVKIVFAETDRHHPLVWTEQSMPLLPFVRVKDAEEAMDLAIEVEQGFGHTIVIHSMDMERLSRMSKRVEAAVLVKNGSSLAGVGVAGEGFISFHIATGAEGHTCPTLFTRPRRCCMVDFFRLK